MKWALPNYFMCLYLYYLDPPGTPVCIDVTRDSVTLQWDVPKRDGGSKIVGYSVERRQGRGKWLRCNFTDVCETQYTVTALSPGDRFEFRVIARNAVGTVSPPSNSSGYIMTKDESSMFFSFKIPFNFFIKLPFESSPVYSCLISSFPRG